MHLRWRSCLCFEVLGKKKEEEARSDGLTDKGTTYSLWALPAESPRASACLTDRPPFDKPGDRVTVMVNLSSVSGEGGQNQGRKNSESTLKCCYLGLEKKKKNAVSHTKHDAWTCPWWAGAKIRGSIKGTAQPQGMKMNLFTAPQLALLAEPNLTMCTKKKKVAEAKA